jgi:hypothetical protein
MSIALVATLADVANYEKCFGEIIQLFFPMRAMQPANLNIDFAIDLRYGIP